MQRILQLIFKFLGGLIDWGHHGNNAHLALSETVLMAKAVKKAQDMTNTGRFAVVFKAPILI